LKKEHSPPNKGGFKDLSQITIFAILFKGEITIFGNTGATLNCGESLYPIYNNYKKILVKK
jgi:hypothetical protein